MDFGWKCVLLRVRCGPVLAGAYIFWVTTLPPRGVDFQCADFKGGQVFSAQTWGGGQDFSARKSENSSAPLVPIDNDRSLKAKHLFSKRFYRDLTFPPMGGFPPYFCKNPRKVLLKIAGRQTIGKDSTDFRRTIRLISTPQQGHLGGHWERKGWFTVGHDCMRELGLGSVQMSLKWFEMMSNLLRNMRSVCVWGGQSEGKWMKMLSTLHANSRAHEGGSATEYRVSTRNIGIDLYSKCPASTCKWECKLCVGPRWGVKYL